MIKTHKAIDIDTFASKVKNQLRNNIDVKLYQNFGEIEDDTKIETSFIYTTVVSVVIDKSSIVSDNEFLIIVESIVEIFNDSTHCKDIASLDNTIIAIFDTPFKSDIDAVLETVGKINALFTLVDRLGENKQSNIRFGIGISYAKTLCAISLRMESTQLNTWSGDSVEEALLYARKAATDDACVYASFIIFNNLKDEYKKLFIQKDDIYSARPINIALNNWIKNNI